MGTDRYAYCSRLRQVDPAAFLVSKENVGIEGKFEKHLS